MGYTRYLKNKMSRSRSRGRSPYPTPKKRRSRSPKSANAMSLSRSRSSGRSVRSASLSSVGSLLAAGAEAATGSSYVGRAVANYMTKPGRSQNYSSGYSGGRFGRGRKFKGRLSKKGKLSVYGAQNKGILAVNEITYNSKSDNVLASRVESIAVGHTSMPVKLSMLNLCRAMMKYMILALNLNVTDFGDRVNVYGIVVDDIFEIRFYANYSDTTYTVTKWDVTANQTWDEIAYQLALKVNGYSSTGNARFVDFAYVPAAASKHSPHNQSLMNARVHVFTKSIMNVQNRSVTVTADNEADDVNNVPLTGKMIVVKGNNLLRKAGVPLLTGINSANITEESLLFKSWTRNDGATIGGTGYGYQNYDNRYLIKPNEAGSGHDYKHCVASSNVSLEPGQIKSSVLSKSFTMSFDAYFSLLGNTRGGNTDKLVYDPKLGFTKVLLLSKKISSTASDVVISVESEFRQTVAIVGYNKNYTAPITYQYEVNG